MHVPGTLCETAVEIWRDFNVCTRLGSVPAPTCSRSLCARGLALA